MLSTLRSEPVRIYLYGVLAAVVAVLVLYGVLDAGSTPIWLALGLAALALPSPVEGLRSTVTPASESVPEPAVVAVPLDLPPVV